MKNIKKYIKSEVRLILKLSFPFIIILGILYYLFECFGFDSSQTVSMLNSIAGIITLFLAIYAFSLWRIQRTSNALFEHKINLMQISSRLKFITYDYLQARLNSFVYHFSEVEEHKFDTHPRLHETEHKFKYNDIIAEIITASDLLYIFYCNQGKPSEIRDLNTKIHYFRNSTYFLIDGLHLKIENPKDKNSEYTLSIEHQKAYLFSTLLKSNGYKPIIIQGVCFMQKKFKNNMDFYFQFPDDFSNIIDFYYNDATDKLRKEFNYH